MAKHSERSADQQDELEELLSSRSPSRTPPVRGGGVSPLDVLQLPPDLQRVMNLLVRRGASTAAGIALTLEMDIDSARDLLETLIARGHVRQTGTGPSGRFEPILGRSRRPRLSSELWQRLQEE